jgi:hypothetical protein
VEKVAYQDEALTVDGTETDDRVLNRCNKMITKAASSSCDSQLDTSQQKTKIIDCVISSA